MMYRTDRRKAWGRCPEPDCDWCVQGKAKTPFIRHQRHKVRQIIKQGAMVADLTGQVGLCMNGTTWIARAIQWFTRSKSYHVVVAWTPELCVSAEPGGVLDRTNADETHAVWSRFDLTSEERAAIIAACKSSEKLPYNYAVYPILAISRLTHIPVPKFVADWLEGRRNVDCSQLAAQIYAAAGLHLFVEDSDIVTPGDWERKFRQLGFL